MNRLIIIGAGGHGKVVADIARLNGYEDIAFLDDDQTKEAVFGCPVIGPCSDYSLYHDSDFFVAIGNCEIRRDVQMGLTASGLHVVTLVHPFSAVASDVILGTGTVVMAGTVINPGSVLGKGCIVNTGSTVDHDCTISDYAHISVGAHVAGTVKIGQSTWIGAGAVIKNNISICSNCMIGAGAVLVNDATDAETYIGVPAKIMRVSDE
ncbi:acetyltransferase [Collinsella ihumii]|uniref:Acetyltransferase n=1 Tax=Collinsella ihumii TaxID=1720204 RepID=A0AAW7JPQ2_9ACTN|nr:acetyltransferase [Collinsella ihumii]MDN0069538.1 acetyltransferase [Collinsella ihumii]